MSLCSSGIFCGGGVFEDFKTIKDCSTVLEKSYRSNSQENSQPYSVHSYLCPCLLSFWKNLKIVMVRTERVGNGNKGQ